MDTLGLILAVVVMAASATDNQIGTRLVDRVAARLAVPQRQLGDQSAAALV